MITFQELTDKHKLQRKIIQDIIKLCNKRIYYNTLTLELEVKDLIESYHKIEW